MQGLSGLAHRVDRHQGLEINADGAGAATPSAPPGGSLPRPTARALSRHSRLRLVSLLTPPLGWLVLLYLGSLGVLLASAFWQYDSDITFSVTKTLSLEIFQKYI